MTDTNGITEEATNREKVAIISVDGHVRADWRDYRPYVESAHHEAFDEWLALTEGAPVGGVQDGIPHSAQWDPAERLALLETQGAVAEVLFPNGEPFSAGRSAFAPDPVLTRAGNVAYNRWLADFCSHAPERFRGLAQVTFDDVDQAVADIHWAKEHGLGGVLMPPLHPGGTFFFDPALDPVWAACVETGLPLSQHGGTGAPDYQPRGFAAILVLATEHSFFSGRSLAQMILGGVFERFPSLRIGYVETETWWMIPVIQQLDRRMKAGDDWTAFAQLMQRERAFTRLASEYWMTNCFAGISPFSDTQLPYPELAADAAGDAFRIDSRTAMFGVDFPHFESIYPATSDATAKFASSPGVTDADVHRVLYGNAADLYGFDMAALAPHVERAGSVL